VIALMPNADAGGDAVRAALQSFAARPDFRVMTHMPRGEFLSWLARADALVGNSSSGIIEAASLGLWVVNAGTRQNLRERGANVIDAAPGAEAIRVAVASVLDRPRGQWPNLYGDGRSAERMAELLATLALDTRKLDKINAY